MAAILDDPGRFSTPTVGVLSGGNIDPLLLSKLLRHGLSAAGRYLGFRCRVPDYPGSLAALLGLLAGPLNGAAFGREVFDFNDNEEDACNTGHFIMALDVKRFTPLDAFKSEMDRHLRELRSGRALPGFDAIRLPGHERRRRRQDRLDHGMPMPAELVAQLDALAGELGVKPLRSR